MTTENVKKLIHYFIDNKEYELLGNLERALNDSFMEGINAMRDIEENHELYKSGKEGCVVIDLSSLVAQATNDIAQELFKIETEEKEDI